MICHGTRCMVGFFSHVLPWPGVRGGRGLEGRAQGDVHGQRFEWERVYIRLDV